MNGICVEYLFGVCFRYDAITDIPMPAVNLSTLISFRYIKFDEVAGGDSSQGEGGDGRS